MFLCGAFSALPLINARARAALKDGSDRVELVKDTEVNEAE